MQVLRYAETGFPLDSLIILTEKDIARELSLPVFICISSKIATVSDNVISVLVSNDCSRQYLISHTNKKHQSHDRLYLNSLIICCMMELFAVRWEI